MESLLIFILDLFGTAVFAVTGAVKGVRHKLDIFGVTVLACCVGVGGGMVRDCIIGAAPVAALRNEQYILICIATGIAVFYTAKYWMRFRNIIQFGDAVGLGVFTALGAQKGFACNLSFTGIVLCGVFTAIGGGIIRDVLVGTVPAVLKSDFYATASLIGGILFCLLLPLKPPFFPMFLIIAGTVTGIRLLAIHFRIQLPAAGHSKQ
ncbi:MAG: trimeric intracellular cation channel family protein [Victivallales bacterium]